MNFLKRMEYGITKHTLNQQKKDGGKREDYA